jgi:AcrR family transcriptional regulator
MYVFRPIRFLEVTMAEILERQTHIVQSAQPLFAQFGLKNVTTDDIAREARVSKATIYKHFKNKTEIFDRVIQDEADLLLASIRKVVDAEEKAVDKLRAHLMIRLGKVSEFVNFYRVTQKSWGDYWPHISQVRADFLNKERKAVAEILDCGVRSGELNVDNLDGAALVMVLALASIEHQWFLDEDRGALPELVDTMLEMMVNGIGRRP